MDRSIPFDPIREAWGEYPLENGIVARIRNAVLRIEKGPEGEPPQIKSKLEFLAQVPDRLRGKPTDPLPPRDAWKIVKAMSAPEPRRRAYSLYDVEGLGLLLIRCRVREIRIHDSFNRDGEPILSVDAENEILGVSLQSRAETSEG